MKKNDTLLRVYRMAPLYALAIVIGAMIEEPMRSFQMVIGAFGLGAFVTTWFYERTPKE